MEENKISAEEIKTEFRMIISHALLGWEDNIPKEAWELVFEECAKYAAQLQEKPMTIVSEQKVH